jgi:hypothetical protein
MTPTQGINERKKSGFVDSNECVKRERGDQGEK